MYVCVCVCVCVYVCDGVGVVIFARKYACINGGDEAVIFMIYTTHTHTHTHTHIYIYIYIYVV